MKYDLSVIIPARSEEFLSLTVEDILKNKRGKTEVIVGLDGEWADPPIVEHPDLTILYYNQSIGQRAMGNQLARLSKAKYVMKIDAHCRVDEGFDIKLMADMQPDWTVTPALYNLHAFDIVCTNCGDRHYQGPIEQYKTCDKCGALRKRDMVWKPRLNRRSEFFRFDTTLHFQYDNARKKNPKYQDQIAETMSLQGSCFMLTREKYWELNICDEEFGSWGQQGSEVACKTWLSGGKCMVNKKTWYSHLFRTQGGSFGFPYKQDQKQIDYARKYCKELFLENTWPLQTKSLAWLIKRFYPLNYGEKDGVPDWHDSRGKEVLDYVNQKGREFVAKRK